MVACHRCLHRLGFDTSPSASLFVLKTIRWVWFLVVLMVVLGCSRSSSSPPTSVAGDEVSTSGSAAASAAAAEGPPNVVVIFVDDLGYNDVSYNGATQIDTPNIDRLAEQGVIFSDGYVVHPFCGPSRAGLMTGRYPARFGMEFNLAYTPFDERHGLPTQEKTVATYLKQAGYRTGIVGKWQLGAAPPFHPLNRGFDYFYGFLGGGHDYFEVDATRSGSYFLPLSENRGATQFDGYLTDALTDRAISFIDNPQQDPFFLYLAYNAPHGPLQAPDNLIRKYSHIFDNPERGAYLAMVDSLDQNIGRLLDGLEQSGKSDNTIVFFLSDNGGVYPTERNPDLAWADNAPFSNGKESFLEGGIRVPFIASWPSRWPKGETFEPMVSSLDIAATALALAGSVADPDRPLDGVNLDPYIRAEATGTPHEALFWRQSSRTLTLTRFAIRTNQSKLVKDDPQGEAQLFDLARDPAETRDLTADDTEAAAHLAELWNAWNRKNINNAYSNEASYETKFFESTNALADKIQTRALEAPLFQVGIAQKPFKASCSNGIVVPSPEHNPGLIGDCGELMAINVALKGETNLDWTYDEPLYNWDGVTVRDNPSRVRSLDLKSHDLEGSLPSELGNLDGLKVLILSDNQLTGSIPPELGNMTNLRELWLKDNMLTGSIPAELRNLGELELIRLRGNLLTGCVPAQLQQVDNDFDSLGLSYCNTDEESN